MTTDVTTNNKNPVNSSLLIGILLVVLGGIGIALPAVSTIVAETWIAVLLISAGSAKLFYALQNRQNTGFIWNLLLSILYIATAVMLFVNPLTGVLTLTLLLGSFLLTEGTFELLLAFRLRGQQNWAWELTNGIVTLVLGGIVWFQWPSDAPWLIGTIVGASVLFTGISRVMLSLNTRSMKNPSDQAASTL
ncbi:MAG: DUF308 domain-containing protein [Chroococcidiopsidaceae cyanobacterium CP_BM_RX_35]|nr:DUF308 domain-containing protein [Chroococcidiopsidaceae cyanobacterium CP_BM_RX_35]